MATAVTKLLSVDFLDENIGDVLKALHGSSLPTVELYEKSEEDLKEFKLALEATAFGKTVSETDGGTE